MLTNKTLEKQTVFYTGDANFNFPVISAGRRLPTQWTRGQWKQMH